MKYFITVAMSLIFACPCIAWQATYPAGPVSLEEPMSADTGKERLATASNAVFASPFSLPRTIAYPESGGTVNGQGWDFLTNSAALGSCIDFTEVSQAQHQSASLNVREVVDKETLEITLNSQFDGGAKGSFAGLSASASSSLSIDAYNKVQTSDVSFVAHATIESGLKFVGTKSEVPRGDRVSLVAEMRDLAINDPEGFRSRCGDGFVSSIGSGAELYMLFSFKSLSADERLKLSYSIKGSAGFGDIFSGSSSTSLSAIINNLRENQKLHISFLQRGGIISALPTNLDQAKSALSALAAEEARGPKPLYITITPYSALSNWPGIVHSDTTDIKQRSLRYQSRLLGIRHELLSVRDNYYRPRYAKNNLNEENYFYGFEHGLRNYDLERIGELVDRQLKAVVAVLEVLDSDKCKTISLSTIGYEAEEATKKEEEALSAAQKRSSECSIALAPAIQSANNFDDYKLWIELPIPRNSLLEPELERIKYTEQKLDLRKDLLAQAIYRHWVERLDQVRCSYFGECVSSEQRSVLLQLIKASLSGDGEAQNMGSVSTSLHLVCIGEHSGACNFRLGTSDFIHLGCGTSPLVASKTTCEGEKGAQFSTWETLYNENGNRCGYLAMRLRCHKAEPFLR